MTFSYHRYEEGGGIAAVLVRSPLELLTVDKLAANYRGLESYKLMPSRSPMKQYPDCIGSINSFPLG